jgi:Pyruvate/2-oxoacid:ferredoxin oxidoreductase gamma subunit
MLTVIQSVERDNVLVYDLDILVAFDQETIELNHHEMREDSIIIADAKAKPVNVNGNSIS